MRILMSSFFWNKATFHKKMGGISAGRHEGFPSPKANAYGVNILTLRWGLSINAQERAPGPKFAVAFRECVEIQGRKGCGRPKRLTKSGETKIDFASDSNKFQPCYARFQMPKWRGKGLGKGRS